MSFATTPVTVFGQRSLRNWQKQWKKEQESVQEEVSLTEENADSEGEEQENRRSGLQRRNRKKKTSTRG